jgi:hypothetical protein
MATEATSHPSGRASPAPSSTAITATLQWRLTVMPESRPSFSDPANMVLDTTGCRVRSFP